MSKLNKGFIQIFPILILILVGLTIVFYFSAKKNVLFVPTPSAKEPKPTISPAELIYMGDLSNTNWKEFNLKGCTATNNPPQTYSLKLPANWTIMKVHQSFDEGSYITGENPPENFYYSAEGDNKSFTVGCMTLGSKGGICHEPYVWTNFTVDGTTAQACFGQENGKYSMGILYLPSDPKTNSDTAFWAQGLDKPTLDKIFNGFKFK